MNIAALAIQRQLLQTNEMEPTESELAGEGSIEAEASEPAVAETDETVDALDTFFLLASGFLVFFMQCGFCMLSAGSVREKNAKNIILKNLLDACFGALGWYFFGYAFAYGEDSDRALGTDSFALDGVDGADYKDWFFQYAFAATAATIVSGAVAERTKFEAYLMYAFFLTAWVYPNVVHWVWSDYGWLSGFRKSDRFNDVGLIDFAGCGVVHMVGGLAGLAGAALVGPRIGRFDANGKARDIPGHSASLALLGVFILWFGWYGFNPGSALGLSGVGYLVAAHCAVTTTLAAAGGTVTTLIILLIKNYASTGHLVWDVIGAGNGALAGLVGITAACAVVEGWAAIVIGIVAGFVYTGASFIVLNVFKVDDPLDAVAVHGFCGAWGLIAAAGFADQDLTRQAGYLAALTEGDGAGNDSNAYGFFMGGDGKFLVSAIVAIAVITAWVLGHMLPFFFITKILGLLRVSNAEEHEGLDVSHHGGAAYPKDPVMVEKVHTEIQLPEMGGGGGGNRNVLAELDELRAEIRGLKAAQKTA
eukprot:g3695.t1